MKSVLGRVSIGVLVGLLISQVSMGQAQQKSVRGLVSFGQATGVTGDTSFLDVDKDIAIQLLPFEELTKIATAYSPLLKYQGEIANSLDAGYQISKLQILQNMSAYGNYSAGNQAIVSSGVNIPSGVDPVSQIANGYRFGVDMRVTLYDLFGRKQQMKQAYSNYRASVLQKDIIAQEIRRSLIGIYQDMITAQQVLKTRLLDEQASLTAYRIAEAETQKGRGNAETLANALNRYAQAKSYSEQVKGEFLKNVRYFETLVGQPLQRLKRIN
ncbi:TolC family protein [Spirosoma rhododendri]|uniref:TolC family protein n=1 Tax=Spirosoma rhododendri TaxID=2728024 RepID=A0A7L5DLC5_9BACT|nr:TolC family protein [Spirosoma rhododendri]QJD79269.1 TolC family protein [Spirosoma rhododendri]